jgi:hypothetical protein
MAFCLILIFCCLDDSINDVFGLNKDSGQVTLNSELNRNVQSYYNVSWCIKLLKV